MTEQEEVLKAHILRARIRAALRLLSPDEITPMGVRIIEKILDEENPTLKKAEP